MDAYTQFGLFCLSLSLSLTEVLANIFTELDPTLQNYLKNQKGTP